MWQSIGILLGHSHAAATSDIPADDLHHFFFDKVAKVCDSTANAPSLPVFCSATPLSNIFSKFQPIECENVIKQIMVKYSSLGSALALNYSRLSL